MQRADVRAVDVGVGHDDDAVVAELREVELLADPGADRGHDRLDLRVREHLVDPVLLGVDHLPAQRQDRLEARCRARRFGRAAGRVALDEVELGRPRGRGSGSRRACPAASRRRARSCGASGRAPCGRPGARRAAAIAFVMICFASAGFSSRNSASFCVHRLLARGRDPRVAELRLRLPLELRVAQLHRDDRGEALADVLALEVRPPSP